MDSAPGKVIAGLASSVGLWNARAGCDVDPRHVAVVGPERNGELALALPGHLDRAEGDGVGDLVGDDETDLLAVRSGDHGGALEAERAALLEELAASIEDGVGDLERHGRAFRTTWASRRGNRRVERGRPSGLPHVQASCGTRRHPGCTPWPLEHGVDLGVGELARPAVPAGRATCLGDDGEAHRLSVVVAGLEPQRGGPHGGRLQHADDGVAIDDSRVEMRSPRRSRATVTSSLSISANSEG